MLSAVQTLLAQTERFTRRDADLTLHGAYVPTAPRRAPQPERDADSVTVPPPPARSFTVALDAVQILRAVPSCLDDWAHSEREKTCLLFVSGVLLRHAKAFLGLMAGPGGAEDAAVVGSHRVNFVVWAALSVFKGFLEENMQQPSGTLWRMEQRLESLRVWFDAARGARDDSPFHPRPLFDLVSDANKMVEAYKLFSSDEGQTEAVPTGSAMMAADAMSASDVVFDTWFHTVLDPLLQSMAREVPTSAHSTAPVPAALNALSTNACGAWYAATASTRALSPDIEATAHALASHMRCQDVTAADHREALWSCLSSALDDVLQIVSPLAPTHAGAQDSADTRFGRLGGFWQPVERLIAATHGTRGAWYQSYNSFRWFVDVPGLSMAATVVQSAAVDGGVSVDHAPDASTPASTLLFVPPRAEWLVEARSGRGWVDAAMLNAHRVPTSSHRPSPSSSPVSADVVHCGEDVLCSQLPVAVLEPIALLLLFSSLPDASLADPHSAAHDGEELTLSLADLHAFLCASLRARAPCLPEHATTLAVIVVQSEVDKRAAREIESWRLPNPLARLLVVSAVGEWTLTQLCLRFQVLPNSPYTFPASALRGVWDGTAGVLLARLDGGRKPQTAHARGGFTELWERYLVVIGGRDDEHVSDAQTPTAPRATTPANAPMATGVMRPPSSSSSSSSCSSARSLCEEPNDASWAGTTSQGAQSVAAECPSPSSAPLPPLCGSVKRSIWLGGHSAAAQLEAYHYFELFRRRQVREALLPREARLIVSATEEDNVELRLLAMLDSRGASEQATALDSVALLQRRLEAHMHRLLRDGAVAEFIAAGDEPHAAWQRLTRCTAACQSERVNPPIAGGDSVSTSATELLLDVRYAYWTLLQCAAELCRTVTLDDGACQVLS